jgi:hypothetical protein
MIIDASSNRAVIVPKNTSITLAANTIIVNGVTFTSSILPTPITVLSTALKNDIISYIKKIMQINPTHHNQ